MPGFTELKLDINMSSTSDRGWSEHRSSLSSSSYESAEYSLYVDFDLGEDGEVTRLFSIIVLNRIKKWF